jgi:septum site-determining protein MinC
MTAPLTIKGIREGLLITVGGGEWEAARAALLQSIDVQGAFFNGAKVALQLGERTLGAADLGGLREALADRDVQLWAILSDSPQTRQSSADLGLALALTRETADDIPEIDTELLGDEAVLVHRTLRSGNTIRHPGHVVVIGDVNPGAEIIAGGNVVVWGRLRGVVHAGAKGDPGAFVCALDLSPTQLRIAGQIAVSPERRGNPRPEMARIRDGQLIAEYWSDDRRR